MSSEAWHRQQYEARRITVEMLIVACLCCVIARWLHGQESFVEV